MNLGATTSNALKRLGFLDRVNMYSLDKPNEWKGLIGTEYKDRRQLYENLIMVSGLSPATEYNDGDDASYDTLTTPYEKNFYPVLYEKGMRWSVKAAHNDLGGLYKQAGQMIGHAHYEKMEIVAASVMNNATSGSYTGIDGVALASASHPRESGTWSNISTAALLSIGSLETMVQDVVAQPGYRTGSLANVPGPWVINVGVQDMMLVQRILNTYYQQGTANNDKSVIGSYIADYQVNRRFTSTTAYILVPKRNNPLFILRGMPFTDFGGIKFDENAPSWKLHTLQEFVFGWETAAGIQYNAGA